MQEAHTRKEDEPKAVTVKAAEGSDTDVVLGVGVGERGQSPTFDFDRQGVDAT